MFREADGKVYCASSDLINQETSYVYNPHYIIAAKQEDNTIYLDMLSDSVGEVQPDIKRLTLEITDSGYRLPAAY
jgi:outer membrane lipopolysaccharide assembly protein LptE/RlpB